MFPRWLSWLVVAFLAYLVIQTGRQAQTPLPKATAPVVEVSDGHQTTSAALAEKLDVERWKRAVNPDYAKRTQCSLSAAERASSQLVWKVTEDAAGNGEAAGCGETIHAKFTVWDARGGVAYSGACDVALGAREVAAGLDAALVGIRSGGVRTVVLPPSAQQREKSTPAPKPLLNALNASRVVIVTVERE